MVGGQTLTIRPADPSRARSRSPRSSAEIAGSVPEQVGRGVLSAPPSSGDEALTDRGGSTCLGRHQPSPNFPCICRALTRSSLALTGTRTVFRRRRTRHEHRHRTSRPRPDPQHRPCCRCGRPLAQRSALATCLADQADSDRVDECPACASPRAGSRPAKLDQDDSYAGAAHRRHAAADDLPADVHLRVRWRDLRSWLAASSTCEYLLPGLLGQSIAMGSVALGQNLNADIEKGVFDRFRSLPIASVGPVGRRRTR